MSADDLRKARQDKVANALAQANAKTGLFKRPAETAPSNPYPDHHTHRDPDDRLRELGLLQAGGEDRKPTGWMPIETAPKDETEILGWARVWWTEGGTPESTENRFRRVVMHFSPFTRDIDRQESGKDGEWLLDTSTPYNEAADPTHWMPLPEPPTD